MENKTINLIAAVAIDGAIGGNGKLLWKIPKDLEFYKAKTYGNVVIMGLETYKTLPKVALKGRHTVVVCKVCEYDKIKGEAPDNVKFGFNIQEALDVAKVLAETYKCNIFIAGGASIYEQMMEYCDYAFITWVDKTFEKKADKYFSISKFLSIFDLISESEIKSYYRTNYLFATYKRKEL